MAQSFEDPKKTRYKVGVKDGRWVAISDGNEIFYNTNLRGHVGAYTICETFDAKKALVSSEYRDDLNELVNSKKSKFDIQRIVCGDNSSFKKFCDRSNLDHRSPFPIKSPAEMTLAVGPLPIFWFITFITEDLSFGVLATLWFVVVGIYALMRGDWTGEAPGVFATAKSYYGKDGTLSQLRHTF